MADLAAVDGVAESVSVNALIHAPDVVRIAAKRAGDIPGMEAARKALSHKAMRAPGQRFVVAAKWRGSRISPAVAGVAAILARRAFRQHLRDDEISD